MKERPILFSTPMVQAILAGRKTQTRRIIKLPSAPNHLGKWEPTIIGGKGCVDSFGRPASEMVAIWHTRTGQAITCPYGQPRDRLWVRETWRAWERESDGLDHIWYRADGARIAIPDTLEAANFVVGKFDCWYPSIHMPRWASRLTLNITEVRAERLHELTEEDAIAEGAMFHDGRGVGHSGWRHDYKDVFHNARSSFCHLWDSLNAERGHSWESNPWVWVIIFRKEER